MTRHDRTTRGGVLAFALLTFAPPAFAYLDPSTGSMILSAVVGLAATAALAVKTYWYKLKSFFRQRPSEELVAVEKPPVVTENSADS